MVWDQVVQMAAGVIDTAIAVSQAKTCWFHDGSLPFLPDDMNPSSLHPPHLAPTRS